MIKMIELFQVAVVVILLMGTGAFLIENPQFIYTKDTPPPPTYSITEVTFHVYYHDSQTTFTRTGFNATPGKDYNYTVTLQNTHSQALNITGIAISVYQDSYFSVQPYSNPRLPIALAPHQQKNITFKIGSLPSVLGFKGNLTIDIQELN